MYVRAIELNHRESFFVVGAVEADMVEVDGLLGSVSGEMEVRYREKENLPLFKIRTEFVDERTARLGSGSGEEARPRGRDGVHHSRRRNPGRPRYRLRSLGAISRGRPHNAYRRDRR